MILKAIKAFKRWRVRRQTIVHAVQWTDEDKRRMDALFDLTNEKNRKHFQRKYEDNG